MSEIIEIASEPFLRADTHIGEHVGLGLVEQRSQHRHLGAARGRRLATALLHHSV
jgi:hypothetical protein